MHTQFSVYIRKQDKRRLHLYLSHIYPYYSRSYIDRLIGSGNIRVNGDTTTTSRRVHLGDIIGIDFTRETYYLKGENMPLEIIFDSQDFVIISKDAGVNTHTFPGEYGKTGTLLNAILYHFGEECHIDGVMRPGIIHRLDKDTSGLIIIAKNSRSMQPLQVMIAKKEIQKFYYAIVLGMVKEGDGIIESYIGNDPLDYKKMTTNCPINPKFAKTKYKLLQHIEGKYSLLEVELYTGRTHQIRVHLESIGHPILGDKVYGDSEVNTKVSETYGLSRQWLHARRLRFSLFGVAYDFIAPLKGDLMSLLEKNGVSIQ